MFINKRDLLKAKTLLITSKKKQQKNPIYYQPSNSTSSKLRYQRPNKRIDKPHQFVASRRSTAFAKHGVMKYVLLLGVLAFVEGYIVEPGPVVHATSGEVWPLPQVQEKSKDFFSVRPTVFKFKVRY